MNKYRLTKRKQVQLLVALTILAWATQTLFRQWGYGQEIAPVMDALQSPGEDKFVPLAADCTPSGTLELRQDAVVSGSDVKLKQVCRWSDADAPVFTPVAELTLLQLTQGVSSGNITVGQISQTLHEAGVNVAMINFAGSNSCSITRSDAQSDPQQTIQQWVDAQSASGKTASPQSLAAGAKPDPSFHTLHDLLVADLSQRLNIPADSLQLTFSAQDEKLLSLAEPLFKFDVQPSRARALGNVSWEVKVINDSASKKFTVSAVARAIQDQVVVAQPLSIHRILEPTDFTTRRVLVDSTSDKQLLKLDQCIGQEAAQDLRPGMVMTSQLVNPVPMVKPGQLVTINLRKGMVNLRSVARAMEQGALGQTIRVRNENTRDMLEVTVVGNQEARLGDDSSQGN